MRPVYICQLSEEKQAEIRKMLEGLILHSCGGEKDEVERYYGMSFEKVVQNSIDLKIVDLDYLMVFCAEEFNSGKADEQFRLADAAVISGILREARKHDEVSDFIYLQGRCGQQSAREDEWQETKGMEEDQEMEW